jgi:hypothetical protein
MLVALKGPIARERCGCFPFLILMLAILLLAPCLKVGGRARADHVGSAGEIRERDGSLVGWVHVLLPVLALKLFSLCCVATALWSIGHHLVKPRPGKLNCFGVC